jgi:hypothetical protein
MANHGCLANQTSNHNGHTANLEVTGHLALIHAHELLQGIDIERKVLRILDKLLPLKALRKRTHRRLRLDPRGDAGDNDRRVRHFAKNRFCELEGRQREEMGEGGKRWRRSDIGASYLYRVRTVRVS